MIFRPSPNLSTQNMTLPLYDKGTFSTLVILSIACFFYGISVGINLSNFAIYLSSFHISTKEVSQILSLEILGNIGMAPFMALLTRRLGIAHLIIVSLVLRNFFLLIFGLSTSEFGWSTGMIGFGLFGFSLYTAIFQHINIIAINQYRGTYISVASVLFGLGIALGPILVSFIGIAGSETFIVSVIISSLMIIPLLFLNNSKAKLYQFRAINITKLLKFAHIPIMCAVAGEFAFYSMLEFLPVYTTDLDKGSSEALMLVSYFGLSGLLLGIPLGILIDKCDRIKMIMLFTFGVSTLIQLVPFVIHDTLLTFMIFSPLSACMNGTIICGLVIIGDKFCGNDFVAANSTIQAIGMIGGYAGIRCTGNAIELVGGDGLIYSITSVFLVFCGMLFLETNITQFEPQSKRAMNAK